MTEAALPRERWTDADLVAADPASPFTSAVLLAAARGAWGGFVMVHGDPADIAAGGALRLAAWRLLQLWLRALERLARGLVLMMAFAIAPKPAPGPPPTPRRKVEAGQADDEPDRLARPADPALWRVSLPILRHGSEEDGLVEVGEECVWTPPAPRVALAHGFKPVHDPLASARRAEAVLRIVNDPAPFAQRLASRLSRLWAPMAEPQPPRLKRIRAASIDYGPQYAPRRREPYDHWIDRARERCAELIAGYWGSG